MIADYSYQRCSSLAEHIVDVYPPNLDPSAVSRSFEELQLRCKDWMLRETELLHMTVEHLAEDHKTELEKMSSLEEEEAMLQQKLTDLQFQLTCARGEIDQLKVTAATEKQGLEDQHRMERKLDKEKLDRATFEIQELVRI